MLYPIIGDVSVPVRVAARSPIPFSGIYPGSQQQAGQAERRRARVVRIAGGVRTIWLALAFLAVSGVARSADIDLMSGGSVTSHGRNAHIVAADWLGKTQRWKNLAIQPDVGLTYVSARHHQGADFSRDAAVAAVGVRLPDLWHHLFFSFQVGAAAPQTPALSSTQQFVSTLGWSRHGLVVLVRHISNGSTRKPNLGETMLLVGMDLKVRR